MRTNRSMSCRHRTLGRCRLALLDFCPRPSGSVRSQTTAPTMCNQQPETLERRCRRTADRPVWCHQDSSDTPASRDCRLLQNTPSPPWRSAQSVRNHASIAGLVSFQNRQIQREVTVIMEEPFVLNVYFERKKLLTLSQSSIKFSLKDYYGQLGVKYLEKTNDVKTVAAFIKEHLISIVKGEKWIDELLKHPLT